MLTVRVCSKLKTSWKLVVFTDIVGKNSRYFVGVFNKTIIPLARVGDKMIIAKTNSALRASLAITISYPTRSRGIIANYAALFALEIEKLLSLWMTKSQCQKPQLQSVLYFLCYDTFFNFFDSIWVFVAVKSKCRSWLKIFNSNLFLQTSNLLFKTFHFFPSHLLETWQPTVLYLQFSILAIDEVLFSSRVFVSVIPVTVCLACFMSWTVDGRGKNGPICWRLPFNAYLLTISSQV